MKIKANAKINLGLAVLGERPDGYHDISTVMQSVDLYDVLELKIRKEPGIHFTCSEESLPVDEKNLAYRAALRVMEMGQVKEGLEISLTKGIPLAAGLAGGSADAAAALRGVNALFELNLSEEVLLDMGKRLGADIPFCMKGGTLLCEGIGEILSPAPPLPSCVLVLAKPREEVSTKEAYGSLGPVSEREVITMDPVLLALREGSLEDLGKGMKNAFESGIIKHHPSVGALLGIMEEKGALGARMSGSGPTVFGIFHDEEGAKEAMKAIQEALPDAFTALTRPAETGLEGIKDAK